MHPDPWYSIYYQRSDEGLMTMKNTNYNDRRTAERPGARAIVHTGVALLAYAVGSLTLLDVTLFVIAR